MMIWSNSKPERRRWKETGKKSLKWRPAEDDWNRKLKQTVKERECGMKRNDNKKVEIECVSSCWVRSLDHHLFTTMFFLSDKLSGAQHQHQQHTAAAWSWPLATASHTSACMCVCVSHKSLTVQKITSLPLLQKIIKFSSSLYLWR